MRFLNTKSILVLTMITLIAACKSTIIEVKGPRLSEYKNIEDSNTIIFIHGMYLTPKSWDEWEPYFQSLGYDTYSPAWPYHELSVFEQNSLHPSKELGALTLPDVLQYYRDLIATLDERPILIGHSMGGLIAQLLLGEGLAAGAIAIHSAPPLGVISVAPEFIKANFPHLNPVLDPNSPTQLRFNEFKYGFVNGSPLDIQEKAYTEYAVPESRKVGRATLTKAAKINRSTNREPLLLIAGGNDHTIPAALSYSNFNYYKNCPSITDYKMFPERNHFTIKQQGWEEIATYTANWIATNKLSITKDNEEGEAIEGVI